MMAQQFMNATITALEINTQAFQQAKSNFDNSRYAMQIKAVHTDVVAYSNDKAFDFIICNPPYFQQSLHTAHTATNTAKHATQLTFAQLAESVSKLLSPQGTFSFIIPYASVGALQSCLLDNGLCINSQINIRHNASKPILNAIINGGFGSNMAISTSIFTIKNLDDKYTPEALDILTPFYFSF